MKRQGSNAKVSRRDFLRLTVGGSGAVLLVACVPLRQPHPPLQRMRLPRQAPGPRVRLRARRLLPRSHCLKVLQAS